MSSRTAARGQCGRPSTPDSITPTRSHTMTTSPPPDRVTAIYDAIEARQAKESR
ncbi:hypothetical protein [Streptomyces kebangsaanensis]|uniref:hypothetical protein n=1 Tax=Streptomyces kebangsaanensis TaxID=864058 RepID=UPI000B2272AF|nr:hypothetical protein [Streptomyces kebangsaanensis]